MYRKSKIEAKEVQGEPEGDSRPGHRPWPMVDRLPCTHSIIHNVIPRTKNQKSENRERKMLYNALLRSLPFSSLLCSPPD